MASRSTTRGGRKIETEKYLESKLKRVLQNKNHGCLIIKFVPLHFAGFPDRICLMPKNRFCLVEVKETGIKPDKLQLFVHRKIRALGVDVRVIDSSDTILKLIEDYDL